MPAFSKDLLYAARSLRKNLAFTLTAVLTLGLGIGASAAIFSIVNAVLLRPLPYESQSRLVLVWSDLRNRDVKDFPISPADFHDLRERITVFDGLAGLVTGRQAVSGDDGEPEHVRTAGVTPNIFSLLGARVILGRDFTDADATPQAPPPGAGNAPAGAQPNAGGQGAAAQPPPPPLPAITILSHGFWQRRYGGDPRVIGRFIDVDNGRAEIVGVLEPGFELLFPPGTNVERAPDIYTALRVNYEAGSRINVFLRLIGRLKPGATIQQAQTQLDALSAELRRQFPIKETAGTYFRAEAMHEDLVADVRPAIVAIMGAVIFVLLIACANVANLLLVRAGGRGRELAVRAALGGSRWRLVRQMLAESLLLAGAGVLTGVLLARLGIWLLLYLGPENLPRLDAIEIDGWVLGFAIAAGVLAAIVFGVMPAIRASRPDIMDVLRSSGRNAGLGGGRLLRNAVVTAEVALSFVLLIGCGLMIRSFMALQRTDPGYDASGTLTFVVQGSRAQGLDGRAAWVRDLQQRLRTLPGVQSVTAAGPLPLDGGTSNLRYGPEEAAADPLKFQQATMHAVLPGYFEAMRTRLVAGRTFTEADNNPQAMVVVIDELLAQKTFPNQPAVGKRLLVRARSNDPEPLEIIGVVAHQRHASLAAPGPEALFLTDGFLGHGRAGRWAVRTTADPVSLAPPLRTLISQWDSRLAVGEIQPMQLLVERAQARTRFALVLIGIFAVIAAVLAAVGLYGVLSTAVRQRTAEMGVRMAFGATPSSIVKLVVGYGLRLSAVGIVVGIVAALGMTRIMSTMLVGVEPTDPLTFAAMAVLFAGVAVVASLIPARRAARLDPTVALRED